MAQNKQFAVYILASQCNGKLYTGTLYTGMTSNLPQRIWQHKNNVFEGFTTDHSIKTLVWFELHDSAEAAITREKQIKKWNRAWKLELIEASNPNWHDLYPEIAAP